MSNSVILFVLRQLFLSGSFEADLELGFKQFNASYTSHVTFDSTLPQWTIRARSINSTLFERLDSHWVRCIDVPGCVAHLSSSAGLIVCCLFQVMTPVGGGTAVEFNLAFTLGPGSGLLRPVVNSVLGDVAAQQVEAFQRRAQALVASGALPAPGLVGRGPHGTRIQDHHRRVGVSSTGSPLTGRILQR